MAEERVQTRLAAILALDLRAQFRPAQRFEFATRLKFITGVVGRRPMPVTPALRSLILVFALPVCSFGAIAVAEVGAGPRATAMASRHNILPDETADRSKREISDNSNVQQAQVIQGEVVDELLRAGQTLFRAGRYEAAMGAKKEHDMRSLGKIRIERWR